MVLSINVSSEVQFPEAAVASGNCTSEETNGLAMLQEAGFACIVCGESGKGTRKAKKKEAHIIGLCMYMNIR